MKNKIILFACILSLISSQIFSMWFFSNQTQYVTENWISNNTDKKLENLLSKNQYSDVIQNLNHFIYEQKSNDALKWALNKAQYGYVPLIHFIIKYNFNLYTHKLADSNQIEYALILALTNILLTQVEIYWLGCLNNEKLVKQGLCTSKNLKTTYQYYFSKILSEYKYNFQTCQEKAITLTKQIFSKMEKINPAWICTTSLYKEEISFNNPDDTDCILSLGGKTLEEIFQLKNNRLTNLITNFNKYKDWKEIFS